MRTSLNEIKQIDDFLHGNIPEEESIVMQVKLWINPLWRWEVSFLKKTFRLVHLYGRKKMKDELNELHDRVFTDPDNVVLHQKINNLFPEK